MVTIQTNSDNSGSESEDDEITNLYLIMRESAGRNDESEEVTLKYSLTFT